MSNFKVRKTINERKKDFLIKSGIMLLAIIAIFLPTLTILGNFITRGGRQWYNFRFFIPWIRENGFNIFSGAAGFSTALLITALIVGAMIYLGHKAYLRISDDITIEGGSAKWGNPKHFNKQFSKSKDPLHPNHFSDLILSQNCRISTDTIFHKTAINTLIYGSTGSGKSRFFVKPNVLQMNASYLITDPKGELSQALGPTLIQFGYEVKIFDIFDKEKCNTYNPFKYINCEEDVATLAQQLMDSTKLGDDSSGSKDPFWDLSSLAVLRAIIFLLWKYADDAEIMGGKTYVPCFASVNLLLALAMQREGKAPQNATLEGSYLDEIFNRVKASSPDNLPYCCMAWDKVKGNPLNPTAATIIANTASRLDMFTIERIKDLTSSDTIDINTIGERKLAIFLIMNPKDKTFNFLLNMFYTQAFNSLYMRGNHLEGTKYLSLKNGDFIKMWTKLPKERKSEYEARVKADAHAIYSPTIRAHYWDKTKTSCYYDILDANGKKISARPTREMAEDFCKQLKYAKVQTAHGNFFPFHTRFIIDEAFNVGKIPDFVTVLSTIRGYNGSVVVILQDRNQAKAMYDKEAESVEGNCLVQIILGVADNETAEYVSKCLGKTTVAHTQQRASQDQFGKGNGIDYNTDVKSRELMMPDEIRSMSKSKEIIIVTGADPIFDDKHSYICHPLYEYTSDNTHIPFDRSRYKIKRTSLTTAQEGLSYLPEVKPLTEDTIKRIFAAVIPNYNDDDYTDDDDFDDNFDDFVA